MQKSFPLTIPHSLGAHHRKTRRRHNVAISGTCISMSPCCRHRTCVSSCACKGIIMQLAATTPWGVHHILCRGLAGWVMNHLSCTGYAWSSQPLARRERPSDLESPARLCWALLRSQLPMSPGAQHPWLSQAATHSRLGLLVGLQSAVAPLAARMHASKRAETAMQLLYLPGSLSSLENGLRLGTGRGLADCLALSRNIQLSLGYLHKGVLD